MRDLLHILCCSLLIALASPVAQARDVEIGTYYFPGWHRDPFMDGKDTWEPIRAYPDREPQRGWYDDRDPQVLQAQAEEMALAGIDFVVFDWYFEQGKVQASAPLDAYLQLSGEGPLATLMWCRHGRSPPTTAREWREIVAVWTEYARNPRFYRIDGRPVVMVFDTGRMAREAEAAGSSLSGWVAEAQEAMRRAGLPPLHFVAGVWAGDDPAIATAGPAGFRGVTSYNFSRGPGDKRATRGYAERDAAYRRQWERMAGNRSGLPTLLPITAGWDKRPWGGSTDPASDPSTPSDAEFREHLSAARAFMAQRGLARAIICCWNEYGEGSVIEPTRKDGDARLNAIRETFWDERAK